METGVSGVESGGDCFCRFLWEGMSLRKGVEMVDDPSGRFRFSYVFYSTLFKRPWKMRKILLREEVLRLCKFYIPFTFTKYIRTHDVRNFVQFSLKNLEIIDVTLLREKLRFNLRQPYI